jgi:uncharacterized Rmd1/YagE family protein
MEVVLNSRASDVKKKSLTSARIARAHQIAEAINIRSCKTVFKGKLIFSDNDELFFERYKGEFVYIFKYGVVCTYNADPDERVNIIKEILPHCKNPLKTHLIEKIDVCLDKKEYKVTFDKVNFTSLRVDSLRLIMLHVSQSVALDRYAKISGEILRDTEKHTTHLEINGRLNMNGLKLKKYIGRVLNVKNKISDNLYIFDSPEVTWEDEALNKLDQDLKLTFDLKDRYRSIHDLIEIIKDNLELFKDITYHRESSRLEWIIIILILVEVVHMVLLKFFNLN